MTTEKKLIINLDSNMTVDEASSTIIGAVKFAIEKGGVFTTDQITQLIAAMAKVSVPTEPTPEPVQTSSTEQTSLELETV